MVRNLVSYTELVNSDPGLRDQLLEEKLGIQSDALEEVRVGSQVRPGYDDLVAAGKLIYTSVLSRGKVEHMHDAYGQMSLTNIAAVLCGWEKPGNDISRVSDAIAREFGGEYRDFMSKYGDYVDDINFPFFLRRHVVGMLDDSFVSNLDMSIRCWGDQVKFSPRDLLSGITVPLLDTKVAFLLGVYAGDARLDKRVVRCHGRKTDLGLYSDLITPIVHELFNYEFNGHNPLDLRFESIAHYTFVRMLMHCYGDKGQFMHIDEEAVDNFKIGKAARYTDVEVFSTRGEFYRAYFAGLVASSLSYSKYHQTIVGQSVNQVHLKHIQSMAERFEVDCSVKPASSGYTENQSYKILVDRSSFCSLFQPCLQPPIIVGGKNVPHKGLIYHPCDLERIED